MNLTQNPHGNLHKRRTPVIVGIVVVVLAAILILLGMALGRGHGEPDAVARGNDHHTSAAPTVSDPTVEDTDADQTDAEAKKEADKKARQDLIDENNKKFGDMKKQYADLNEHEYEIFTICSTEMPSHKLYRQLEDMQPFSADTTYYSINSWDMTQTDKLEAMRPVMAEYDRQTRADYAKCQSGDIKLHDVGQINNARQQRTDEATKWARKQH